MAIASDRCKAVVRLAEALGLGGQMVKSFSLRCAADEAVTLTVERYATAEQVEAFAAAVESGEIVPDAVYVPAESP